MRSNLVVIAMLGVGPILSAADTHAVKLNGQTFTLPIGFEIEQVAGPPLVKRPIAAAFDDAGLLFVTEASGTNDPVAKQIKDLPHTLLRLVSSDGQFKTGNLFADRLMLPQGVMARGGSVYVGHPPVITNLTDRSGQGVANSRETWFDGKTLTGCANDLHGPYAGPDGWIYWTKGAFARQEYTLPGGKAFTTKAAHIFRARPDGTGIEPVMTGGMDNPVDVVHLPTGERFFTTTFFQHPANGKRDGLVHAVYGGLYGKDHDPVYEHPWTGPNLMPVMTHLGAAAPCGLHRYEHTAFGPDYTNNLFSTSFNMHKLFRHVLISEGATFRTVDADFVVSDSLDFHPTDVIEDADGSLLIIDTGGWYKLCCPTSQLVKPDVFGAIYRVKKTGAVAIDDPRGLKIDWAKATASDVAKQLADPRPAVRERAIDWLGAHPESSLPVLETLFRESRSAAVRRNVLWAAARFDLSPIRTIHAGPGIPHTLISSVNFARNGLTDPDESVRLVALYLIGLNREKSAVKELIEELRNGTPRTQRAVAEALGRIGDPTAVPVLLAAHANVHDRVLQHSFTYALIEIANREATRNGLTDQDPLVRRAALIALDQMPKGELDASAVVAELSASDASLRDAAWWIAGRHPEWGGKLATVFAERLRTFDQLTPADRDRWIERMVKFSKSVDVQTVLAEAVADKSARPAVLATMARSGLKVMPTAWAKGLTAAASPIDDYENHKRILAVFRAIPANERDFDAFARAIPLTVLWSNTTVPMDVKLALLAARPPRTILSETDIVLTLTYLHRDQTPALRSTAVEILHRSQPTSDQLRAVAAKLPTVSALDLPRVLDLFAKADDDSLPALFAVIMADAGLRASIRPEQLRAVIAKASLETRTKADGVLALLEAGLVEQKAKFETIAKELPTGDVRRGQVVFNGPKANCIACHQMGYLGGKIGPDLTRIGGIRAERDLLEAIVFPSASFVRSYEPVKVTTHDGRVFQGILKKDAEELVLAINATEEVKLPRADVETVVPGTVSVMPSGLDQQLSRQDLADLIVFLKASK